MITASFDVTYFLKDSIIYLELLTAFVASFYYYKYKETRLIYILCLLWFTVVIEFTSYFLGPNKFNLIQTSYWIYNYIYHPVNFTILLFVYSLFLNKSVYNNLARVFTIGFLLVYFLNMFFQDYKTELITLPFIVGGIFIILSISFYFIELLNSNKVLYVSKNLLFWVSVGLLIYFAGKIPMRLARNYWYEIASYDALSITGSLLSIIMNICFIIGFIWSERRYLY